MHDGRFLGRANYVTYLNKGECFMKRIYKKDSRMTWIIDLVSFKKIEIPFWGKWLSPVLAMLNSVYLWAIIVEM